MPTENLNEIIEKIIKHYPSQYKEDLYQELYLHFLEIKDKIDYQLNAKAYVYKCLFFKAKSAYLQCKTNNTNVVYDEEGEPHDLTEVIPDKTNNNKHYEALDYLERLQLTIPTAHYVILEMHYHGWPVNEIAQQSGYSERQILRIRKKYMKKSESRRPIQ